jgi:hypothetical protein
MGRRMPDGRGMPLPPVHRAAPSLAPPRRQQQENVALATWGHRAGTAPMVPFFILYRWRLRS